MDSETTALMDHRSALKMYEALSQESRLLVFVTILAAGPEGYDFPDLNRVIQTRGTALSLHLRALQGAGLVQAYPRRDGRKTTWVVARADRWLELRAWMAAQTGGGWSTISPDVDVV